MDFRYYFLAATLALFGVASSLRADVGVAYYAMQGYNRAQCEAALRVFNGVERPALAILWGTFGKSKACLKKYLKRHPNGALLIHATNETCRRLSRTCEAREVGHTFRWWQYNRELERKNKKIRKELKTRARSIKRFILRQVGAGNRALVSTGLEDNYTTRAYKTVYGIINKVLKDNAEIIRNPVGYDAGRHRILNANIIELHGTTIKWRGRTCIYSNDGVDIRFGHGERALKDAISISGLRSAIGRNENCIYRFIWWNTQGIESKFLIPSRRSFGVYRKDVNLINKILKEQ